LVVQLALRSGASRSRLVVVKGANNGIRLPYALGFQWLYRGHGARGIPLLHCSKGRDAAIYRAHFFNAADGSQSSRKIEIRLFIQISCL